MLFKSRRTFIKLAGASLFGSLINCNQTNAEVSQEVISTSTREYQGADFSGWGVAVGDGIYAAPGEPPVNDDDIETVNHGDHSELLANIQQRGIMAHNITFVRMIEENAFDFVYSGGYKFRLPYLPSTINTDLNAQTLEGGMFIWDGGNTRLDYGLAFQWMLNPWGGNDFEFGDIRCWTDIDGGKWQKVGYLQPDISWHELRMVFDFRRRTTSLTIDGKFYPSRFTGTPKPETWGTETAPGLQAEIISIYPGEEGNGTLHKAEFQDWFWIWEPYNSCEAYLPIVLG